MKFNTLFVVITVVVTLFACHSEPDTRTATCYTSPSYGQYWNTALLCTSDTCTTYQPVWKTLFLEKNGMSEADFTSHITPLYSNINKWNYAASYTICYKVTIGWAIFYVCDELLIELNADAPWGGGDFPRNTLLTQDQIRKTFANPDNGSVINTVPVNATLHFSSSVATVAQLMQDAHVNALCFGEIYLDQKTGHPFLGAFGQFTGSGLCISAYADLITGETSSHEGACAIE